MATVAATPVPQSSQEGSANGVLFQWDLQQGDDGRREVHQDYADRSVQVSGTFGGASVDIEGSNDGSNWSTLNDPQGNALTFSGGSRIEAILELSRYIRPKVTGGDGTTAILVSMLVRIPRA